MDDHPEMTHAPTDGTEAIEGLEARLRDIEQQPLVSRAAAFGELHDDLRRVLEGAGDDTAAPS
ncbi:hypothetical protein [Frigoribacterium sp. Leaf263]|uniref:hypothetical protein n=1 Tax=Frigoribacterium sp. Leaf263 TaxID=1736313 RepID=UPI000AF6C59E|nr:hypothetical protein [Frigoribacterium sp. Leaf263]